MDYFSQFLILSCTALGLFLTGAANLVLFRRLLVIRLFATLLSVGIALATAVALNQPGIVANTARLLGCVLVPCALLGSRRLSAGIATVHAALRRPLAVPTILSVMGIGLALGSVVLFEHSDEMAIDRNMTELNLLQGGVANTPVEREKAVTDRGHRVALRETLDPHDSQVLGEMEAKFLANSSLRDQVMRVAGPDERSNCHGWVFTGGRYVMIGSDIERILEDNGYTPQDRPQPGDLVVYRSNAGIEHSGVVQYVTDGEPVLVKSKWGNLGVYLHPVNQSPYGSTFTFYRSPRKGHLLSTTPTTASDPSSSPMASE